PHPPTSPLFPYTTLFRSLKPGEAPRIGWLVDGEFDVVDGGSPVGRFFLGSFGVGQSVLALHVRVTNVKSGLVVYEFDMYGGSERSEEHTSELQSLAYLVC